MVHDTFNTGIDIDQLIRIAPFIVATDELLTVKWASEPVLRRINNVVGLKISDIFEHFEPTSEISPSIDTRYKGFEFRISLKAESHVYPLSGWWIRSCRGFILLARPYINKMDDLNLFTLNDFTENDPTIELLTAREEHNISLQEARFAAKALWQERNFAKSLVDTTPVIILILNEKGHIVQFNSFMEKISGYSLKEAYGKDWFRSFVHPKDYEAAYAQFQETINNTGSTENINFIITKDGKELEIEWRYNIIRETAVNPIKLLAIGIDITQKRQEEKKRQLLEIEINQARKLEAVGFLAAGIAHEINNPIQFIGDNTNFLFDAYKSLISLIETYDIIWQEVRTKTDTADLDSEKLHAERIADLEYLKKEIPAAIEQTLDGVGRVTKIVRAMKDFSHSDQGTKSSSNLNQMIESTLTVAHNALKYVANVETCLDTTIPNIECYRDELNQVFLNLLINSAHAIENKIGKEPVSKGTITISTSQDNGNIIIKIGDTGTGIPKAIRNRIFDPFFTTKDVGKGSGQGLAIARNIIMEKHKGSLGFETEEGKGTTFIISLPNTIPAIKETV